MRTDDDGTQEYRVQSLANDVLNALTGVEVAEVHAALLLAVAVMLHTIAADATARRQAAEDFASKVRELAQREDLAAWIQAAVRRGMQ
jgi:hypothetical protein